jgi:Yip1 domain
VTLPSRLLGIILSPRSTCQALAQAPRWADVLILSTVAAALAGALVMRTGVGQIALVDQWERTAVAFGQPVDDAAYARLQQLSERGSLYEAGVAILNGPVQVLAVAGFVFLVLGGRRNAVTFRQVLSIVSHAGVFLALRQIIGAASTYFRETTASATALGLWFPMFDESSPAARFLGAMDLLVIWWVVVLGIGIAVLYRKRTVRVASALAGVYAVLALMMTVAMALAGGE